MTSALGPFHRNVISLAFGEAAFRALGFVVSAVVARRLGIDALGALLVAQNVIWYALVVGDAGLSSDGTRRLAGHLEPSAPLIAETTAAQVAVSLVATGAVALAATLLPLDAQAKHLLLFLLPVPLLYALNLAYVLQSRHRMRPVAIGRVVGQLAGTAIALIGVIRFKSLASAAIAITIGQMVTDVVLVVIARSEWRPLARPSVRSIRNRINSGKNYLYYAIVNHFAYSTPLLATAVLGGISVTGTYGVVNRLLFLLTAPAILIGQVALPRFSADAAISDDGGERLHRDYRQVLGATLSLVLAGLVPFLLFPEQILQLLFGSQATRAATALRVALLYIPFAYFNFLSAMTLLARNRAKQQSLISIGAAALLIGSLLVAVPVAGATGTSTALLISEVFMAGLFLSAERVIGARALAALVVTAMPYLLLPAAAAVAVARMVGGDLWWTALPAWLTAAIALELILRRVIPRQGETPLHGLA